MAARTCVIMQPAYLPWIGFYDLADQADEFVFLDTVQFSKQSWQQRNRIRWAGEHKWLTVPVHQIFGQTIDDVKINHDHDFAGEHLGRIRQSYEGQARYYEHYFPVVASAIKMAGKFARLCDATVHTTAKLGCLLGMRHRFGHPLLYRRTSQMKISGGRSERLVDICRAVKCDRYLSPIGAKSYLLEDRQVFDAAGIDVELHNYEHPEYDTNGRPFVSHMSAVDLLLNCGPDSLKIVRSGRRATLKLEE